MAFEEWMSPCCKPSLDMSPKVANITALTSRRVQLGNAATLVALALGDHRVETPCPTHLLEVLARSTA